MLRCVLFLSLFAMVCSCSSDALQQEETLADWVEGKEIVVDNVIACAASNANDNFISVFFYPREGVTNIKYFETEDATFNKNDYYNYQQVEAPIRNVFNGYLKKFEVVVDSEKWVVVSFDEAGKTHLSNPIRLKHDTKPTEYVSNNIEIDTATNMPNFVWNDGQYDDTKIYFQVISDASRNLLSGTYTLEKNFSYYVLDNVVLNITKDTPPALLNDADYNFTLMGVSEDNWVNLFSEKQFQIAP